MADAVARQWLGVAVYPFLPRDAWVTEGLAVRLREAFLLKHLGKNEATYRCSLAPSLGMCWSSHMSGRLTQPGMHKATFRYALACCNTVTIAKVSQSKGCPGERGSGCAPARALPSQAFGRI